MVDVEYVETNIWENINVVLVKELSRISLMLIEIMQRKLQDEEDNDLTETGSKSIDISLSSEDNDGPNGRRKGPNYGTNGRADKSGRTPLTVGGNRFITPSTSRAVSANLKSYLGGPYPTCSLVPVDIKKKLLWERFQLRLHEKLGKPPTASQLFERIHRRNKGEGDFVDNKSRIFYETDDNAINEKYGSNASSHPEIDIEAWCGSL
ncbi:unnamed protein product [Fraxinus pennsylvanica]|uniref:Uncharacterized protein n=1 Tax=Fraxinus pennsylvanica TaxID=56036 RepID=A0AAD1ZVR2_9LAMI|nr:unnamed protein product [Fraxinus pennsylvanica]